MPSEILIQNKDAAPSLLNTKGEGFIWVLLILNERE
jgi:hypothetical protein